MVNRLGGRIEKILYFINGMKVLEFILYRFDQDFMVYRDVCRHNVNYLCEKNNRGIIYMSVRNNLRGLMKTYLN